MSTVHFSGILTVLKNTRLKSCGRIYTIDFSLFLKINSLDMFECTKLYFVIIRSPNYCSGSVPPGPRSRKRLFKARLQRKKPCTCDYFLPSFFRSALQDPDVLLVPHRFVFTWKKKL